MRKLYITLIVLAPLTLYAKDLKSFKAIKEAVLSGQSIAVRTDFDKCASKTKMPISGIFFPKSIMVVKKELEYGKEKIAPNIAFSNLHFTIRGGVAHYESITYKLTPNNNLQLKTLTLNPQTFAPLKSKKPSIIHCQLNEGAFVYTR